MRTPCTVLRVRAWHSAFALLLACNAGAGSAGSETDADTSARADAGGAGDAAPVIGSGTWSDPIEIGALPFSFAGDTASAPSDAADYYSTCAPDIDESGGEYVFHLTLAEATTVTIAVDDRAGDDIDIDVHLLPSPSPDDCATRDNRQIRTMLSAGDHWISADTYVDGAQQALAGPFTLTVAEDSGAGDCFTNPITCDETDRPLVNGVPTEAPGQGGCPAGMVSANAGAFCVDRYEAMLVLVDSGGGLSPWSPYSNPGANRVRALSVEGVVPQGYITQVQASAACAEAGKRLCTDTEWLRACQGSGATTYPYGDTLEPGLCNEERACHPVIQYFESSDPSIWSQLGHPCINQLPEGLDLTGENATCLSEDGALDMMGNLHEWTADPEGTFRGGYYVDTVLNGPGCLYRTTAHNVSHWDYSTGFRCCAD